jgi:hypothetical protein
MAREKAYFQLRIRAGALGLAAIAALCLPDVAVGQWSTGSGGAIFYNNGNVGIGTANPVGKLSIGAGPYFYAPDFAVMSETNGWGYLARATGSSGTPSYVSNNAASWGVMTTRGTQSARAALANGHAIGDFFFNGYDGATFSNGAVIAAVVNGAVSPGVLPGALSFRTSSGGYSSERMRIDSAGNVGIGTVSPQYKLAVNGTVGAREVIVTNSGWADYVFRPGYRLAPLREVAAYIQQHRRLPGIPSEAEVRAKGVGLGEMQVKLLEKVEELTLHMIAAERRNRELEARVASLEAAAAGSGGKQD